MEGSLFLLELGGLVVLLAILARLATRFGFSPIPLYLLAGLAFGDGGVVPLVTAEDFIRPGAQVGITLLLFSLGLQYSVDDFTASIRTNAAGGVVDLVLGFGPGFAAGLLFGWGPLEAFVLGGVTYVTSSSVVARALDELGWFGNRETPIVLTLSVIEDIVMAAYLPLLTVLLRGGDPGAIALSLGFAVAAVGGALVLAVRVGERASRLAFSDSDEALLLAMVGVGLLVAGVAQVVGVSAGVGAFLAGIFFSGPAATRAQALLRPLRDVFAGVFFLFFGFQIDPRAIPDTLWLAVGLAVVSGATKYVTGWWAARRAGIGSRGRIRAGAGMIARGEFSIAIAGLALASAIRPEVGPLAATYVLLLAAAGPIALKAAQVWAAPRPPA